MSPILTKHGVSHRVSYPHTHEQQGRVERKHQHIVETGLSLLAHSSTPARYWQYAFETAVFLINRLPSVCTNGLSPFDLVHHSKPDYSFLKAFGCLCFPHLRTYNKHKFDFRSKPCVFLGYRSNHLGYRCLDYSTGRIYIARQVRFDESRFPFAETSILGSPPNQPSPSTPWASFPVVVQSTRTASPVESHTTKNSSKSSTDNG